MNGTTFSVTCAMDLIPPTMTANTTTAKTTPVIQPGKSPTMPEICACAWLAWNMFPPPNAPPMVKIEKTMAKKPPNGRPRSLKPFVM